MRCCNLFHLSGGEHCWQSLRTRAQVNYLGTFICKVNGRPFFLKRRTVSVIGGRSGGEYNHARQSTACTSKGKGPLNNETLQNRTRTDAGNFIGVRQCVFVRREIADRNFSACGGIRQGISRALGFDAARAGSRVSFVVGAARRRRAIESGVCRAMGKRTAACQGGI